ncbi:unnamed protein product [Prorocentrum cordatum]|uniref:Rad21/Rec8-like protein C-terminal eukaryotic domain-containing protein n=1 Tax=Prorocentrum cordatum TaxID=2364126 RepID=A0ABN9S558_9DINO|nr:unnamed protein product [Polarella glacialis]
MEAEAEDGLPVGPAEGEPGEPPSRRRRQEEPEEGAADDYPGLEQAAVSREQEAELQAALGGEGGSGASAVSFLELCERPPGGAEAAAQRFLSLLALHMEGAVTVSQEEPYGDILIGRGVNWSAAPMAVVAA